MLSLDLPEAQFNYRVAAVIVQADHVLLHRAPRDAFWSLPGGRCEINEPSAGALARELREEVGAPVRVERLLWVVELFFSLGGRRCHELGLYHLVTLLPDSLLCDLLATVYGREDAGDLRLIFRWFPLAAIGDMAIVPRVLRARLHALHTLPTTVEHIVSVENLEAQGDGIAGGSCL